MSTTKPVLLFAFANDREVDGRYLRNLAEELRAIRHVLDRPVDSGLCSLIDLPNATPEEVFDKLLDPRTGDRIATFHFAGHSGGAAILLETSDGKPSPVYAGGLAQLLGQLPALQLVFLNGCTTKDQADKLIAAGVPAVIATSQKIDDAVAVELAKRFYQALAGGYSIRASFEKATSIVKARFGASPQDSYCRSFVPNVGEELNWPWKLHLDKTNPESPADLPLFLGLAPHPHPMRDLVAHPQTIFSELLVRSNLFDKLLAFARERDIVFALGGAGSGLKTFTRQFREHLGDSGSVLVESADFEPDHLEQIEKVREVSENFRLETLVHLELKCLLTALMYDVYDSLRSRFPDEIKAGLGGRYFTDPLSFSDYYFASANSESMYKSDPVPIMAYFFETIQSFAEMTGVEEVLVLMPWPRLAKCFRNNADPKRKNLGGTLWKALGDLVTRLAWSAQALYAKTPDIPTLDIYDKVCLIVCCSEVPYAHHAQKQRSLVARCIWPIPPLVKEEVKELVAKTIPDVEAGPAAAEIINWTGGAPWYVRLLMSYVSYNRHRIVHYDGNAQEFTAACAQLAMQALESDGDGMPQPVREFIELHHQMVKEALGDSQPVDDSLIEQSWTCPLHRASDGYKIRPYRLEAFVASGLIWLAGDPWDARRDDYVFKRYPTVFLVRACDLPLAMYRSVTGNDVRLTAF